MPADQATIPGAAPGVDASLAFAPGDAASAARPPAATPLGHGTAGTGRHNLRLEVHSELAAIGAEWRSFEGVADCTVFQTFGWLEAWQSHIGRATGAVPAIVFARDGDGRLVLILPLAIERRRGIRRLRWLGSDLCDYNAPLLAPGFDRLPAALSFADLWADALRLLRQNRAFRFDLIDLWKMPERIGGQPNPLLALRVATNPNHAYVATLGGDWEAFYAAKRSGPTRKRERRQLRQLSDHGEVVFLEARRPDDLAPTLTTLMFQKARVLTRMGVADMFARPGYAAFYRAIAADPGLQDVVHLTRLDVGPSIAAASIGLRFRDCYYLVLSSYDDGELSRFGPGRAHLHRLIERAIGLGLRNFDFTIGDEPYKREWSDRTLTLYDYVAAITPRGIIAAARLTATARIKRFIKQTPVLWRTALRVREWLGFLRSRRP